MRGAGGIRSALTARMMKRIERKLRDPQQVDGPPLVVIREYSYLGVRRALCAGDFDFKGHDRNAPGQAIGPPPSTQTTSYAHLTPRIGLLTILDPLLGTDSGKWRLQ